jgi:molybdopterin-guanine dinucleotide biosynthesis protein A
MTIAKHKKHVNLELPKFGNFGRNEWAVLGTTCSEIKSLSHQLIKSLYQKWEIAYLDADHKVDGTETVESALRSGASLEYTNKISHRQLEIRDVPDNHQLKVLFNITDLILVNGNHFQAQKQVLIVNPLKEESLRKRFDQLTDVRLVLLPDGVTEIPDFLKEKAEKAAVLRLNDIDAISSFFHKQLKKAIPPLKGMVLAGGKSKRMRFDKGQLVYHSKPQREHMGDVITGFCEATFLSCRFDQVDALAAEYPPLFDTFFDLGPMGALLSAFRSDPNAAWLSVACDLPFLDEKTIDYLVNNRNPSAIATAFKSPENEFPEPLVAIWEPKSYPVLLQFMAQGHSCPRKVLINSKVHLLDAPNPLALKNVNTPEEFDEAIRLLDA